ncbi:MAG: porin, partial [Phycisphaerae bacterium]|nr:porin [Phycisphaerae bacterium]
MSHSKGLSRLAVAAAVTCASMSAMANHAARAADVVPASASSLSLDQASTAAASQTKAQYMDDTFTPWTLQSLAKGTTVGNFMDNYKLALTGFVEGGYTFGFQRTPGRVEDLRVFDVEREHLQLDQADLQLSRAVDFSSTDWNVGGLLEVMYGRDARFIHSNGMDFYGPGSPELSPPDQFDIPQAYVVVNAPVGNGLKFTVGKFVTLLGYETINPTSNALYSHSYMFGFAIPFTNTGVLASYKFSDNLNATVGLTRGWDQTLKDDNGDAPDLIGQINYTTSIKGLSLIGNFITGPESPGTTNRYWRTVLDGIATYAMGDNWVFAVNADFGYEPHAGIGGKDANWYGAAAYATYKVDPHVSITGRGEYFNDENGARGIGASVYEATLGVEIHPFPTDKY